MFIVTVHFQILPEHTEAFTQAMLDNARDSVESEPGCHQFDVTVSPSNASHIFLYEVYQDPAAFDQHLASAHFRRFDEHTRAWVKDKTVATFHRLN